MTHKYGKTDTAQTQIVADLRKAGATVQSLADVGDGCPDLLVGRAGMTFLLEVKTHRGDKLTPAEEAWHARWRGEPVYIVHDSREALTIIGAYLDSVVQP